MKASSGSAAALCAAFVLAALCIPSPAAADYDNGFDAVPGALLVSADYSRLEQADDTTGFAAISADGRYVAFQTRARNFFADDDPDPEGQYRAGGIFRFDLQTRALEKVADGDLFNEADNSFVRHGASNPSIDADGRLIAFSTDERLVPADTNDNIDVYVRDMSIPLPAGGSCTAETSPCPFQLVSARNGGDEPASYAPVGTPIPGSNPGSEVSRGVAISADGSRVVFRTTAPSDLPESATTDVPAGQIFVRDLTTKTTTLVTAVRDPETGQMTDEPAGGALGATISGDGSTVAWTGGDAVRQARFLKGEVTDPSFDYYLWRRIADGPTAPTRRITGVSDPDDQPCAQMEAENPAMTTAFDQTSTGPCYGPLTDQESLRADISSLLPALSGDGYEVAFLTGAGPRPDISTGAGLDLYLTSMRPGLSRKEATTELTRDGTSHDPALAAPIESVAMSEDGKALAIATVRTTFTLPALHLVGQPRAVADTRELYAIDLAQGTIERVTHSYEGGEINGDVQPGATISAGGGRIAFTSFAGNLFFGDANQRPDAFVATREDEPSTEGPSGSAEGGGTELETIGGRHGSRLSVRVRAIRAEGVVLGVSVPAAGRLAAVARERSDPSGPGFKIASGSARAPHRGTFRLLLHLAGRYRANPSGKPIRARATVSFFPAGGSRPLRASVRVVFSHS